MATADRENILTHIFGASADEWPISKTVRESKSEANILLLGTTGAGKSTLINSLCGAIPQEEMEDPTSVKLPAKVGHKLRHETQQAVSYVARSIVVGCSDDDCAVRRFSIRIWDTPGFLDGTHNERSYVMQANVRCEDGIDLLLYCIDMSKRRCIIDEMVPGMTTVTEVLGQDVWKHAIIVLTFANHVKPKRRSESEDEKCQDFTDTVGHWQGKIQKALVRAGVDGEIAHRVPIEPAGHFLTPHLPDRPHWLGYLWLLTLIHAKESAKVPILVNTQDFVCNSEFLSPTADDQELFPLPGSTGSTNATDEEGFLPQFTRSPSIVIDERAHTSAIETLLGPIKRWIQALLKKKRNQ